MHLKNSTAMCGHQPPYWIAYITQAIGTEGSSLRHTAYQRWTFPTKPMLSPPEKSVTSVCSLQWVPFQLLSLCLECFLPSLGAWEATIYLESLYSDTVSGKSSTEPREKSPCTLFASVSSFHRYVICSRSRTLNHVWVPGMRHAVF